MCIHFLAPLYLYNKPTQCTIFSLCVTTPLHVLGPFVAHHQEAECIIWWMVHVLLVSQLLASLDGRELHYQQQIIYVYHVIHKAMKHCKNSQQIDYAMDHGNSYANRESNSPSFILTLSLLMLCIQYIYGAPCKARNFNARYIYIYIYMDLCLATLKAISFYLLHNVSTMNQCRKFSCVTVVCKHLASYQAYPNYRWDLIR
jgi:hypothetical protein